MRIIFKFCEIMIQIIFDGLNLFLTQPENKKNLWNAVNEMPDVQRATKFWIVCFFIVSALVGGHSLIFGMKAPVGEVFTGSVFQFSDYQLHRYGDTAFLIFCLVTVYWIWFVLKNNKLIRSRAFHHLKGDMKFSRWYK